MTLVTTNIRFDNPEDGGRRWANRKQLYCDTIRAIAPDVIATQEGWHHQIRDIDESFPAHALVDDHRTWLENRMYPCIFVSNATIDVIASGDVWLSETPDEPGTSSFGSNFPRLMTWTRVRERRLDTLYLVANFHLDNSTEETRTCQLAVGLDRLSVLAGPEDHVVLAGDFNSAPGGEVYSRAVFGADMSAQRFDPWKEAELDECGTYHAFRGPEHQYDRIDWILLDRRLRSTGIERCLEHDGDRFPSDHYPVVCRDIAPRKRAEGAVGLE